MSKKNEPYNPNIPDMPPLIDDVILPSKTNAEAEKFRRCRAAQAKAAANTAKASKKAAK
jgi:hypothetical protein